MSRRDLMILGGLASLGGFAPMPTFDPELDLTSIRAGAGGGGQDKGGSVVPRQCRKCGRIFKGAKKSTHMKCKRC